MTTSAAPVEAPSGIGQQLSHIIECARARFQCRHASLTVLSGGWLRTGVASDRVGAELDAAQHEFAGSLAADGWGDDAAAGRVDLAQDTRWPEYCKFAVDRGVRSLLICRLAQTPELDLALSLYSVHDDAFDEHSARLARALLTSAGSMITEDARS